MFPAAGRQESANRVPGKENSRFCDVKFSLNRNKVIKLVSRREGIYFLVRIALQFCRMNVYWPEMLFGMEGFKNRQSFSDIAKFSSKIKELVDPVLGGICQCYCNDNNNSNKPP